MNQKEKITQFVRGVFSTFNLTTFGFFTTLDDDTFEDVEIPLFEGDDVDDETLERISIATGLSHKEIISCDTEAVSRYLDKYPYVKLQKEYEVELDWSRRFSTRKLTLEEYLIVAIFGEKKTNIPLKKRYDYRHIKRRMIKQLQEIDKIMPGTFHEGAEITHLSISTEIFISFPQITEMLKSFFNMIDKAKELFFKALHENLEEDEILEYNFIVNQLEICDKYFSCELITHDKLQTYKNVYNEEGYEDFYQYIKVKGFINLCPWRCKEFFSDISVVQRFVDIFPQAKSQMKKFALEVGKFECHFIWSDAREILDPFENFEGEEDFFEEKACEPIKEVTCIYVEKKTAELYDWAHYVKVINKATSSVAKGGLVVKSNSTDENMWRERIEKRIEARKGIGL